MTQRGRVILIVGLILWSLSSVGAGAQSSPEPAAEGRDLVDEAVGRYGFQPAFEKLGRGISNVCLGWLDIPVTIHDRYWGSADKAAGIATGTVVGVIKGVTRTVVGAYETVSFLVPYPANYAPILPPQAYMQQRMRPHPLPLE